MKIRDTRNRRLEKKPRPRKIYKKAIKKKKSFLRSHIAPKKVKLLLIGGLKNIMYKISNCLPKPFKGSGIAIIAKKNS